MMTYRAPVSAREQRLLQEGKVGKNLEVWWGDAKDTYVDQPIAEENIPKLAAGTGAIIVSAFTDVPDAIIGGVVGKEIPPPTPVPFGRLRRDAVELPKDLFRGKLLAVAADVLRLPGDVFMDTIDVTIAANHGRSNIAHAQRNTRRAMEENIASAL